MGSIPGPGRFHLPWSSLSLQLLKPVHLEPVLCIKRSRRNEKLAQGSWRAASAHRRQRKPVCRSKDPAWPKMIDHTWSFFKKRNTAKYILQTISSYMHCACCQWSSWVSLLSKRLILYWMQNGVISGAAGFPIPGCVRSGRWPHSLSPIRKMGWQHAHSPRVTVNIKIR